MANKKISSLDSLGATPDVADIIPITDVSDTTGSVNGTTKKVTVANLVAAAPQGDLVASNNLSDVASATTSRTNLGLGTAATQDVGTANGNLVQLDSTGLPAVDGSQLTNLPAGSLFNTIVSESTTARTLSDSDCGKVIDCSNGSAVTITIPSTVSAGFNCTVVQSGAGQVTIAAGASVNLYCYSSTKATAGQYAAINIIPYASNSYVLEGDLASSGGGGGGGGFSNTYSLDFDGTDDYLATTYQYASATQFTYSFWIKTTDTGNSHWIGNSLSGSYDTRCHFGTKGGAYYILLGNSSNQYQVSNAGSASAVTDGNWHHMVFQWDGTNTNGVKLYVDGNTTPVFTYTSNRASNASTAGLKWGIGWSGSFYAYDGLMDEAAIWESILTTSDITTLYNGGVPGDISTLNPVGWWRMGDTGSDYGTATITNAATGSNSGGSAINGTIVNGSSGNTSPTYSTDVPT